MQKVGLNFVETNLLWKPRTLWHSRFLDISGNKQANYYIKIFKTVSNKSKHTIIIYKHILYSVSLVPCLFIKFYVH